MAPSAQTPLPQPCTQDAEDGDSMLLPTVSLLAITEQDDPETSSESEDDIPPAHSAPGDIPPALLTDTSRAQPQPAAGGGLVAVSAIRHSVYTRRTYLAQLTCFWNSLKQIAYQYENSNMLVHVRISRAIAEYTETTQHIGATAVLSPHERNLSATAIRALLRELHAQTDRCMLILYSFFVEVMHVHLGWTVFLRDGEASAFWTRLVAQYQQKLTLWGENP